MLKEFIWNAFENTGNIDNYVFYKELSEKSNITKSNEFSNTNVSHIENRE